MEGRTTTNYDKDTGSSGTLRIQLTYTQSAANNTTTFNVKFILMCSSSQTYTNDRTWDGIVAGTGLSAGEFDWAAGTTSKTLYSNASVVRTHDSNGVLSSANRKFEFYIGDTGTSGLGGPTRHTITVSVPNIVQKPNAVAAPTLSAVTHNSLKADWAAPSVPGGGSITGYDVQYSTNSDFSGATTVATTSRTLAITGRTPNTRIYVRVRAKTSAGAGAYGASANVLLLPAAPTALALGALTADSVTATWTLPSGTLTENEVQYSTSPSFSPATSVIVPATAQSATISGLTPAATVYVRVRSTNATGDGPWSNTASAMTLPATPPSLTVTAAPSGASATVTLTPPAGVSTVESYNLEVEYLSPPPIPVPPTATATAPSPITVAPLVPGATYRYRATANIGGYQSPVSAWVTLTQPKPNTTPGDYFDGDTPDSDDVIYGWTGTPGGSTSTATGKVPTGWAVLGPVTTGDAVIYRITGGIVGQYAANVTVKADAPDGLMVGLANAAEGWAPVEEDTTYYGSVYIVTKRAQRMAAQITWVDAVGTVIARTTQTDVTGDGQLVQPGVPTRLIVAGVSPTGVVSAVVGVVDVPGDGWEPWVGGDSFILDGAMLTLGGVFDYFDGDTADTTAFRYDWLGAANASQSTRTSLEQDLTGILIDPDCPPVPAAPRPPTIVASCIDEVGIWRRYWAYIPPEEVSRWLLTRTTLLITTGAEPERQVRIRTYENPDNLGPAEIDDSAWFSEQIVSYLPAHTAMTIDGITQRSWAIVEGGVSVPADHLLYGTGGTPPTWAPLACGISYLYSFDVPLEAELGNLDVRIAITRSA